MEGQIRSPIVDLRHAMRVYWPLGDSLDTPRNIDVSRVRFLWQWLKELFGMGGFLCDTCKYDYRSACNNPDRPNATRCREYRRR